MKRYEFSGNSDDTFGEYNITNIDRDNCASEAPISFLIQSGEDHMVVVGHYWIHPDAGCWTIGITPLDEDVNIPNWPVSFTLSDNGYSPTMAVEVPDDAVLKVWNKDKSAWEFSQYDKEHRN